MASEKGKELVVRHHPGGELTCCCCGNPLAHEMWVLCIHGSDDYVCRECGRGDYDDLIRHGDVGLYIESLLLAAKDGDSLTLRVDKSKRIHYGVGESDHAWQITAELSSVPGERFTAAEFDLCDAITRALVDAEG